MKNISVYGLLLIFLAFSTVTTSSCVRKSGCAAIDRTTKPKLNKRGKPKGKPSRDLFGNKM